MENTHPSEGFAESEEKIENPDNSAAEDRSENGPEDTPETSENEPEATESNEVPSTSGMIPEQETNVKEPVAEVPDIILPPADLHVDEHHDEHAEDEVL